MSKNIIIEGQICSSVNFAMQQNYVPIIRNLVIENESDEVLSDLTLKITFEPEFAREFVYKINSVDAQSSVEISPVNIKLSTEFLFSLTEKIVGTIFIDLYEKDQKIFNYENQIELLAYDEWSGLLIMPEIITAFVTPNHPKVAEVLSNASKFLSKWTKYPSFTGYQTRNPNNVKIQMAAIYAALQSASIIYNNPPASYETIGQRVRLPHTVLEQKQGTCLDLTVTYASCLEAAGLFPLIVFMKGHAYCGCWLDEQTFADCAVDDVSALEKRIVSGSEELLLVECTDFTAERNVDFERALKHGKDHLINIDEFAYVIDVQRSRGSGIRPIPVRLESAQIAQNIGNDLAASKSDNITAPKTLNIVERAEFSDSEETLSRQKIWERKLLDFSLRNTLLNFRVTKNSLQLMTANLEELEDKLADSTSFRIMEVPSEWTISIRDIKMFEIENEKDLIQSIAEQEFKSNRIRTFLSYDELDRNLKNLYRVSRSSIEENGTNTLFLALGFLRWFESDLSEKARYAPIVLIPIDIVKSPKNKGYVIRSRQEETQINITLIEYLRQIFGLKIPNLDPLPEDEHGIDLPLVFHTIRQAIMDKKRWNIVNMAFIGIFSFGQFVMWNDIRNRSDELKNNKIVSGLIEKRMNWIPEKQFVSIENLDKVIAPDDMAVPLSADSSQMLAIAAASQGQSFVLHGPPGTGKSQTITNMIANALYHGKSVLFVAEKMAALNVVQNRLAGIGLDPFCLELHSNKTNKNNVLNQLNCALEAGRIKSPEEYKKTAENLHQLRKNLNDVIEGLHCQRDFGISLYEAIEIYEDNKDFKDKIVFSQDDVSDINKETLLKWNEMIRQYIIAAKEIGKYKTHPLKLFRCADYSIEYRDRTEQNIKSIFSEYNSASQSLNYLKEQVGAAFDEDRLSIIQLIELSRISLDTAPVLSSLIKAQNYDSVLQQLNTVYNDGIIYKNCCDEITSLFDSRVFEYDSENAVLRWRQAEASWLFSKKFQQSKLIKELKIYALNPATVTKENILQLYEKLSYTDSLRKKLDSIPDNLSKYAESVFTGSSTDWGLLKAALDKAVVIHNALIRIDNTLYDKIIMLLLNNNKSAETRLHIDRLSEYLEKVIAFGADCNVDIRESETSETWFSDLQNMLKGFIDNISELRVWSIYIQKSNFLKDAGLGKITAAFESDSLTVDEIENAVKCNLYYSLIVKTINSDENLRTFHGTQYEEMITNYRELIEKFRVLTVKELVAKLSSEIPESGKAASASSEIGILKRAIKSNGRMMSIRKLFSEIPTLLRKICPCMLMSPISVAQYIDPSFPKFDLVIFDEASQLPTSEAVGTIARGENVVVVGDPKQLPPTSFFTSNRIDEENIENEDLESLLDDCLSISMPQEYLKWHYRSRHESLIAYSNMQYYGNKLYTFPSPNDRVSEVKLIHVEGFYDKGKTKQNRAEAEAIVKEVIRRLKDEKLKNDSIGVVTFSAVQQNLIDDLLSEEFSKYPELEEQDKKSYEPIFIKNLENVQGDERDVILFSVGYGPDKEGKVSMNFGPLNREGGWRRLNVAISRARKTMQIYATITPDQIDVSRTRSDGVAGLKGFLEFAARGRNVIAAKAELESKRTDRLLLEIADAIRKMNYEVKCNIGCSEYKMDIGIVNPDNPDTYLLGILLDGENCKNASTAKDRFVLQPDVLTGLGWKIMRVWTLDWLDNPDNVIEKICVKIEKTLKNSKTKSEIIKKNSFDKIEFEKLDLTDSNILHSCKEPYNLYEVTVNGTANSFYEPYSRSLIRNMFIEIINTEAPISRKSLFRKVLSSWGISRAGNRVDSILDLVISNINKNETMDFDNIFYWKKDQIPEEYSIYRVEDQNGNKRNIDDICSYEIINAIIEVLQEQVSMQTDDLIRETAKKFGFSRIGKLIDSTVRNAINQGLNRNILKLSGENKIVLL